MSRPCALWIGNNSRRCSARWNGTLTTRRIFSSYYNPIKLYAVNKAVEFVPYINTTLNLSETSVTEQHWSVRKQKTRTPE